MKAPSNEIYDESIRKKHTGYNSVAVFIRLAVAASQNLRNPAKFYENSNL